MYEIRSGDELKIMVRTAIQAVSELQEVVPDYPPFQSILNQLKAIENWYDKQGLLTESQKTSITIGLIAARELDSISEPRILDVADRLHAISAFIDRSV
jgi:hypothetical protein